MVLLAAAIISTVSGKNQIICDYCKQQINGPYIEAGGKYFHPIHFLCENCKKPIDPAKYYQKDGKFYCPDCYTKLFAPRCAYCGGILGEGYILADGKTYHKDCYYNNVAIRCSVCGELITGNYITDFWGNIYHPDHQNEYPKCDYCGRLIAANLTGEGQVYPDGRHICGICLKTAVNDIGRATAIFSKVKLHLASVGIWVEDSDVSLHLVDRHEMADISKIDHEGNQAFIKYYEVTDENGHKLRTYDIYILEGIPEISFIAAAAHELMHVWQYINAPADNDPALCEGSCNYASYLVLEHYPDKMAEYQKETIRQDQDKIYGDGFRRVSRLVEDHGAAFWLRHLKNHKEFPAGY